MCAGLSARPTAQLETAASKSPLGRIAAQTSSEYYSLARSEEEEEFLMKKSHSCALIFASSLERPATWRAKSCQLNHHYERASLALGQLKTLVDLRAEIDHLPSMRCGRTVAYGSSRARRAGRRRQRHMSGRWVNERVSGGEMSCLLVAVCQPLGGRSKWAETMGAGGAGPTVSVSRASPVCGPRNRLPNWRGAQLISLALRFAAA